jgi:hypothetical protein
MSDTTYDRIVGICLWAAIVSALAFQNVGEPWQNLVGGLGIVSAVIAMTTYFYFQSQSRSTEKSSNTKQQTAPVEDTMQTEHGDRIVWLDDNLWREYRFGKETARPAASRRKVLILAEPESGTRYELSFNKDGDFRVRTIANTWKTSFPEEKDEPLSSGLPTLSMMLSMMNPLMPRVLH